MIYAFHENSDLEVFSLTTITYDESNEIVLTHLRTNVYRSITPQSLDAQVFTVFEISRRQGFFCLGIGNERPKINFEKMKNKLLQVFIFSIILKFLENSIQPFMKNFADKKGEN